VVVGNYGSRLKATFRFVVRLSRNETKAKYSDSLLGHIWHILPLLLFFFIIFFVRLRMTPTADRSGFAATLMIGIIIWNFFREATQEGSSSLLNRSDVLMHFPIKASVLTLATTLTYLFSFLRNIVITLGVLFFLGKLDLSLNLLSIIPLSLELFLFCLALNLVLAPLCVFFRDLYFAWLALLPILMWGTPVFYSSSILIKEIEWVYFFNPLALIIDGFRAALMGTTKFSLAHHSSFLVVLVLGLWMSFNLSERLSKRIAERF
jgi:ABC-type polysaccharide/polyol phosphate export permease